MKRTYQPSKLVRKEDMVLDLECLHKLVENFCQEEDQKAGKDFQLELNNDKA